MAGVEGSFDGRFGDDDSLAGRGRGPRQDRHPAQGAHPGRLIRTRDGSVLVYAFLINNPKNAYNAKVWLDRVTAALSTCGCR